MNSRRMKMLTVFTDTDCDVTPEIAAHYNFKLISMPYVIDGQLVYPYVDWKDFDPHEFYDMLRTCDKIPTTCALSTEEYRRYFEPEFAAGNDILYIHFSAAMTSTFNTMHLALEDLQAKYPERKFYEIDTKGITIGALGPIYAIGDMLLEGKPIEEIMKWAETEIDHFAIYFFANDLRFFKKSGRVKGLAAFMGNLVGVKPIINMDDKGVMDSRGSARGRKNAIKAILDYVDKLGDHVEDYRVLICHEDAPDLAKELADKLQEKFNGKLNILFNSSNPTTGIHCGPDAVGVSFHAIHR